MSLAAPTSKTPVGPGQIMRVSGASDPLAVGGAVAHVMRREGKAEVSVIGAGALNQAVKGIAVAAEHMSAEGQPIAVVPVFETVTIGTNDRTAIRLRVVPRSASTEVLTSQIYDALRLHPEWRDRSDGLLAGAIASAITEAP